MSSKTMSKLLKSTEISDSQNASPSSRSDGRNKISQGKSNPTPSRESERRPATVTPAPLSPSRTSETSQISNDYKSSTQRLTSEFNSILRFFNDYPSPASVVSKEATTLQQSNSGRAKRRSRPPKSVRLAAQAKFDEDSWADEVEKEELAEQRSKHHFTSQRPERGMTRRTCLSAIGPSADACQVRMHTRILDPDEEETDEENSDEAVSERGEKEKSTPTSRLQTYERGTQKTEPFRAGSRRASKKKKASAKPKRH